MWRFFNAMLYLLGLGLRLFVSVRSARMTPSLVGPQAVDAFFLANSHFRSMSVCASVRQVALFLSRALSTVQTPPPPPPASLISLLAFFL